MIEYALRARALAVAGVSSLIGTRAYPAKLPQNPTLPAITFARVSGPRDYTHSGESGLAEGRVQFDCWATTYKGAKALAAALIAALSGYLGTSASVEVASVFVIGETDEYTPQEGDEGDWRVSVDFWVRYYE